MIKVLNVSKKIKQAYVLKNISYEFKKGHIYGLFGRNGSGKTMLLRAIGGLIVPTEGEVSIDDKILHKEISFPPSVGVIIENMQLLPQYDGMTNLEILSKIKNVASKTDMEEALIRVGLDPHSKLKVKKFSLGMRQRLNIAQAIFEKPDVLLLDEPTNAIDDTGVEMIHDLLLEEKERGAVIIVTSHHKDEIAPLCDDTLKMSDGVLIND
ncbi:ATP-binding cassette domain-containing protein [Falsibacillus albus]|uniref:ABC transporter ATP-binding protein n=1 Tax=Falsibacillus albus TaxID=2478915 RepID=A0A3L7JVV7_9BACI|nr:ABC transporter ATP-binding protein [Falsibacillus albus]RLQ94886.1 ABC transporter ATP-binding protein [Falsibacillus albus]